MVEEKMQVEGKNICCPSCNSLLSICFTIQGDDDLEEIGAVSVDDVQQRIWFDGIEFKSFQDDKLFILRMLNGQNAQLKKGN